MIRVWLKTFESPGGSQAAPGGAARNGPRSGPAGEPADTLPLSRVNVEALRRAGRGPRASDRLTLVAGIRADLEQLVALVTSPAANRAPLDQMERNLFGQVVRLGRRLLELFLATRVAAESHQAYACEHDRVWPYHSQQPASYFSVFGTLRVTFHRADFYRAGYSHCPLDAALSLPDRCYSDFLMELASLLAVDGVFEKSLAVLARRLRLTLPQLALETWVREASASVTPFYAQKTAFPADEEGSLLVAQADGKGVPMGRQETAPSTPSRPTSARHRT